MLDRKNLLAEIAVAATQNGQVAVVYFGAHKFAAKKAQIDSEFEGLLICENSDEEPISIDIQAIDAVHETDPF